jgi:polygalacturonase
MTRAAIAVGMCCAAALYAQDTRHVTEPAIPPSCAVLTGASTASLQRALDMCPAGQGVIVKGDAVIGPIQLRSGVALIVDRGATLYASSNPRDYDVTPGSCGIVDHNGRGCKPLITVDRANGSSIMGDGAIDGRGGVRLEGQSSSWWDLAQEAKAKNQNQNCPRLVQTSHTDNFTLYRITLKNSPNFHVSFSQGDGFTAWGVKIDAPKTSRNTDGIDPSSATNVTIVNSYIRAGDDNVAIKAGATGPSSHITIAHNHFYSGHGMSIGSETEGGASAIRVTDLSIDGADNGLRIKSNKGRGGLVKDIVYEDVCIRATKNPILMDTHYSAAPAEGNKIPVFRDIELRDVWISGAGRVTLDGFDATHRLGLLFHGVTLDSAIEMKEHDADVVREAGSPNHSCAGRFVAFPQ